MTDPSPTCPITNHSLVCFFHTFCPVRLLNVHTECSLILYSRKGRIFTGAVVFSHLRPPSFFFLNEFAADNPVSFPSSFHYFFLLSFFKARYFVRFQLHFITLALLASFCLRKKSDCLSLQREASLLFFLFFFGSLISLHRLRSCLFIFL